jgi:hypothetical protein
MSAAMQALRRNMESRKQLCEAVEKAIRAVGHVPETAVIEALSDEQLEAVLGYHSAGFRVT